MTKSEKKENGEWDGKGIPAGSGESTASFQAKRRREGNSENVSLDLIGEEPFLIRVNGNPYSVVMRTPGDEIFHAAGFCLAEGIVDSPDDFLTIGHCRDLDPNVVDIRVKPERAERISEILDRRGFVSQTSCGICGKEMISDLCSVLSPVNSAFTADFSGLLGCLGELTANQKYYQRTRGSHAALIFDNDLNILSFAEDVGRHNALDKAIGKAFMARSLNRGRVLLLSSRISYELVQKAARAELPIMIGNSRPTALAVLMGKALGMTIAFPVGMSELVIPCGEERIV